MKLERVTDPIYVQIAKESGFFKRKIMNIYRTLDDNLIEMQLIFVTFFFRSHTMNCVLFFTCVAAILSLSTTAHVVTMSRALLHAFPASCFQQLVMSVDILLGAALQVVVKHWQVRQCRGYVVLADGLLGGLHCLLLAVQLPLHG
jgi:p-aminobenzoyl-glutamate transporter AbgT